MKRRSKRYRELHAQLARELEWERTEGAKLAWWLR